MTLPGSFFFLTGSWGGGGAHSMFLIYFDVFYKRKKNKNVFLRTLYTFYPFNQVIYHSMIQNRNQLFGIISRNHIKKNNMVEPA